MEYEWVEEGCFGEVMWWQQLFDLIMILEEQKCKEIEQLQQALKGDWKKALRNGCKLNDLQSRFSSDMTLCQMKCTYLRLIKSHHNPRSEPTTRECWLQNQLRVFHWVLLAHTSLNSVPIRYWTQVEWIPVQSLFFTKSPAMLKYEAVKFSLVKGQPLPLWSEAEDILLVRICKEEGKDKWNHIARVLFYHSQEKYFRTGKQCRERWHNHLDPTKVHGEWTREEDRLLLDLICKYGKKWSVVAHNIATRTEHMVKNRFNSLSLQAKRNHPQANSQQRIRIIKKEVGRDDQDPPENDGPVKIQQKSVSYQEERVDSNESQMKNIQMDEAEQPQKKCFEIQTVFTPFCVFSPQTSFFSPNSYYANSFADYSMNFALFLAIPPQKE